MTMRRMIPMKVMTIFMAVRHQEILSFPGCLLVQQDEEGPNVKGVNVGISTMAGYLMTNLSVSSISNLAVTINEVTAKRKDGINITDTRTKVLIVVLRYIVEPSLSSWIIVVMITPVAIRLDALLRNMSQKLKWPKPEAGSSGIIFRGPTRKKLVSPYDALTIEVT